MQVVRPSPRPLARSRWLAGAFSSPPLAPCSLPYRLASPASAASMPLRRRGSASSRIVAAGAFCCVVRGRRVARRARGPSRRRQLLIDALVHGAALSTWPAAAAATETSARRSLQRSFLYIDCPVHASMLSGDAGTGGLPSKMLRDVDVAVLGEHHAFRADHAMEADFLRAFASQRGGRSVDLGLEMVAQPLQPVLDAFNRGDLSVDELPGALEWKTRWGWPFERYRPVFEAARAVGASCVALDVPSSVQKRVHREGLRCLEPVERAAFMPDTEGFVDSMLQPGFTDYCNSVVLPCYAEMLQGGQLGSRDSAVASRENFLSAQLLRDEAMATAAWRQFIVDERERSMVVLVGYNHVRFDYGVIHRLRRLGSRRPLRVESVVLNLTPEESLAGEGETDLQLALHLSGEPVGRWPLLADYAWTDRYI